MSVTSNPPIYNFKTYHGYRSGDKTIVQVELRGETKRLMHIVRHSPDGFEWGYGGSGPSDLALSILTDVYGFDPPASIYMAFKFEKVARFKDEWRITEYEVREWLANWREQHG